jgi:hypothetical protein
MADEIPNDTTPDGEIDGPEFEDSDAFPDVDEVDRTPPPDVANTAPQASPVALLRSWRTVLQGLVSAVLVAGGEAFYQSMTGGHFDVKTMALAVGMAVLTAAVTFIHNKVSP